MAGSLRSGELAIDVLSGLDRLVGHSLLRPSEEGSGDDARFGMLETIREYGLERLEASGEADEAHRRHAAYFLALAEPLEPEFRSGGRWLGRLEDDLANLRVALGWAEGADPSAGLRLAAVLSHFWDARGLAADGRGWIDLFLRQQSDTSPVDHARALTALGRLAYTRVTTTPRSPS